MIDIVDDPDGRAFRNFRRAATLSREIYERISLEANSVFQKHHSALRKGELICTVDLGNNCKQYKILKVNEDDTIDIALPDMVRKTVSVSSLYFPETAMKLLFGQGE